MENSSDARSLGQYQLVEKLGEGAAGRVFRARHTLLERDYAVKVLRERYAKDPYFTDRFLREARHAARLDHPNIVEVVTADRHEDQYYLVMEYVEGGSLEAHLADDSLAPRRAVEHARKVLLAIDHAHQEGLLHRDVKAENVLIGPDDEPKLTDFGLVLHVEQETRLTAPNAVVGTPNYMAPEQWANDEVDGRTDVFSAGVLLYYMLSGRFPFPGRTPAAVLHRLTSDEHEPLQLEQFGGSLPLSSELCDRLSMLVGRAIARDPDERYESAAEFARQLAGWLDEAGPPPSESKLDQETSAASESAPPVYRTSPPSRPLDTSNRVSDPIGFTHIEEPEMNDESVDLSNEPVEIAQGIFWVGKRPEGEIFYANPYLRHYPGDASRGGGDFNLLIDPGSSADFSVVQAKVSQILGGIDRVSSIFINHQDPDVASAVGLMMGRYTPQANILCTEDTWRLVHYYNIPRERFVALEKFPNGVKLPTGDVLLPVPSPFCHFVGAMMLYDPSTRVLFSGDLFGGLTDRDAEGLYADESDWTGMRAFHQIYMPTQKALRHAIDNIRQLDPPPEIIAPQHGRVIVGDFVDEYMDRLANLPVGLDILEDRFTSEDELQAWTTVLSRVLDRARASLGDRADELLAEDPNLSGIITFEGTGIEVTSLGKTSVERAVRLLCDELPQSAANAVKYEAIFSAAELDLPTPAIELDEEGGGQTGVSKKSQSAAVFEV
ncbi:MAG: protein kinase domain-containing protein [Persicimonas sp.]